MFLVERHLSGMGTDDVLTVRRAAAQACARLSERGRPVSLAQILYVPCDGRLLCVFESADESSVRRATEIAQLPFERIVRVVRIAG